ncbi:MAG: type II toxin-antitoxin system Phd/YefM family antitoxin [Actinobacteria bacterium]|nr:type II toxin-antitoxin system Phd/YefM family antitoxin [Actinomycetota bacterium]
MTTVSVSDFKAHLSAYLEQARTGERVIVTDRGREIVEVGPLSPERRCAQELVADGRATWNSGKPAGLRGVRVEGPPVSDTVLEDRRDV